MSKQPQMQWYPYPPQQTPYPPPEQPQGKPPKRSKKQKRKQAAQQPVKSQWEHFKELLAAALLVVIGFVLAFAAMSGGAGS